MICKREQVVPLWCFPNMYNIQILLELHVQMKYLNVQMSFLVSKCHFSYENS